MAEQTTGRTEQLPAQYYRDFMAGVPGANVPGIMPLLNQDLVNKIQGLGVEGATPYSYQGQRIADFTPAEQQAMQLAGENVGSYQPYFDQGSQMAQQGYGDARSSAQEGMDFMRQGAQQGAAGINEAQGLLRQVPGIAQDATFEGLGGVRAGQQTLGQAGNMIGNAGIDLSGAMNQVSGSRPDLGQARNLLGSQANVGQAQNAISGALGNIGASAQTGAGSTQGFDPRGISSFSNPYEDQVVSRALQDLEDQGAKADVAGRAQAIGSGAFGGSRARLGAQEREESLREAQLKTAAGLRSQGYESSAGRAQQAFESQQNRQAQQAGLLGNLAGQQAGIGSQMGQLGLNQNAQNLQAGQSLGQLGLGEGAQGIQRGQAMGTLGLGQQGAQLNQANAMANLGSGQAGMGAQIAGMGQNLAGTMGTAAGGLGSLGTGLSNVLGGTGQNLAQSGLQAGQFGSNVGGQMAGLGQGLSALRQGDVNNMMGVGGMQRGQNQAGLDLAYQNFVGQYNLPGQIISQAAGTAAGLAPTLGGTTLASGSSSGGSNSVMQGLGTAVAAYGALK